MQLRAQRRARAQGRLSGSRSQPSRAPRARALRILEQAEHERRKAGRVRAGHTLCRGQGSVLPTTPGQMDSRRCRRVADCGGHWSLGRCPQASTVPVTASETVGKPPNPTLLPSAGRLLLWSSSNADGAACPASDAQPDRSREVSSQIHADCCSVGAIRQPGGRDDAAAARSKQRFGVRSFVRLHPGLAWPKRLPNALGQQASPSCLR